MSQKNNIISKELSEQLRSITFNSTSPPIDEPTLDKLDSPATKKKPVLPPSLHKRVVTLEYLDKLEKMAAAQAHYESIKEFSHLLSNLSIILLSVSIITYLIFYFINSDAPSFISLLIITFEALALLGITIYTISKTSHLKQLADIAASDFSTCSHIIGNPQAKNYVYPTETGQMNAINDEEISEIKPI